jgi:N-(2-amino-2-carboxyethyl)-L-glutamate synthase
MQVKPSLVRKVPTSQMRPLADDGVLSALGNTPLIQLKKVIPELHCQLFAKMESLNPGGSMKDRAAFNIIRRAIETNVIRGDTVIIESSSGNMGIGLAQACRYYGLQFICVVDPKITPQNRRLIEVYGGQIDLVSKPDAVSGEYLVSRLRRVQELLQIHRNAFWPNQYANIDNADAHQQTMREIISALDRAPDYLFCAVSTCGTLRGCRTYLKASSANTRLIAVDAVGSVIFSTHKGTRLIPGHGAAVRPDLWFPDIADQCIAINDMECIIGCRRLAATEAVLVGGSSGAVLMAVERIKSSIPNDAVCVVILADRGERYLDTIYSDQWVLERFGYLPEVVRHSVLEANLCSAMENSYS